MKYAIPAVVLALLVLCLWALSMRRQLTALRMEIDQALERFHAQQFDRINALVELVNLTNEYVPGAVWVRGDVVRSCCGMVTRESSLKDIGKRERIMGQILTQIVQAAQQSAEMRHDARYAGCMSEMVCREKQSRESRLLYNKGVYQFNREILHFPVSVLGRLLELQRREPIVMDEDEMPIHQIYPGV